MKTLKELAADYTAAIRDVEKTVAEKRTELRLAKSNCCNDAVKRITAELAMLYEEIRDMRIIAEKLRNYYDEDLAFREAV